MCSVHGGRVVDARQSSRGGAERGGAVATLVRTALLGVLMTPAHRIPPHRARPAPRTAVPDVFRCTGWRVVDARQSLRGGARRSVEARRGTPGAATTAPLA